MNEQYIPLEKIIVKLILALFIPLLLSVFISDLVLSQIEVTHLIDTPFAAFAFRLAVHSIIFILFCIIAIFVSMYVASKIAKPIHTLASVVKEIADGNFALSIPESKTEELHALETGMAKMLKTTQETIKRLEESQHEILHHSENLEYLVQDRTSELESANARLAYAFERTRRELKTAKNVQEAIMPCPLPKNCPIQYTSAFIPMEELGGDYFDVFPLSDTKVAVVIADVIGHGVSAALITMMAKISFVTTVSKDRNAGEILTVVNRELATSMGDIEKYLTVFFGIIDAEKEVIDYVNAGHPEGLLLRKTGDVDLLKPHAPILGAFENEVFCSNTLPFYSGDRLILYTDGITEARSPCKEFFDKQRVIESAQEVLSGSIEDICQSIMVNVLTFRELGAAEDDMTILVAAIEDKKTNASEAT